MKIRKNKLLLKLFATYCKNLLQKKYINLKSPSNSLGFNLIVKYSFLVNPKKKKWPKNTIVFFKKDIFLFKEFT